MVFVDWFPEFVHKYLVFIGKCYRHCNRPTSLKLVSQDSGHVVGAYVCPDGVVSQVVYISQEPDFAWFEDFLSNQVGKENVDRRDIRVATRHGWELGGDAQGILEAKTGSGSSVKEVYWTRYPKTEEQKERLVSLCMHDGSKAGCMKLFVHGKNSYEKLCPVCRAK